LEAAFSELDENWEYALNGYFSYIVAADAYFLKSGLKVDIGVAVHWLRIKSETPSPIVLMNTALFLNELGQLAGYMQLIENEKDTRRDSKLRRLNITKETNPYTLDDDNIAAHLRLASFTVEEFICKSKDPVSQRCYVETLSKKGVVKRGHDARIPFHDGQMISSQLPIKMQRVVLHTTEVQNPTWCFITTHCNLFRSAGMIMPVEKSSSTCTTMRSLAHLSTCTKLIYLPEHALRNIDVYRKDKNFDLRALGGLICSAANSIRVVLSPPGSRFLSFLSGFAEGSPKVRFISWLL
jgi:hypothetical protein